MLSLARPALIFVPRISQSTLKLNLLFRYIHTVSVRMSDQPTIEPPAATPAVATADALKNPDTGAAKQEKKSKNPRPSRPPRQPKKAPEQPHMTEYKVLMIHGYAQSGTVFHSKVRALEKALLKTLNPLGITLKFLYPTAPFRLLPRDIPGWEPKDENDTGEDVTESFGWFKFEDFNGTGRYLQFDAGAKTLSEEVRNAGGVDIILGFSQGAYVSATVAATLERPYRDVPFPSQAAWAKELREAQGDKDLKFIAVYSGFIGRDPELQWVYDPKMKIPSMHVLGSLDSIVAEERSKALADQCENVTTFIHPGSHYVPITREWLNAATGYFKHHLYDNLQPKETE